MSETEETRTSHHLPLGYLLVLAGVLGIGVLLAVLLVAAQGNNVASIAPMSTKTVSVIIAALMLFSPLSYVIGAKILDEGGPNAE